MAYHDFKRIIPWSVTHKDKKRILACPDCGSISSIEPIENYNYNFGNNATIQDALYHPNSAPYSNIHAEYVSRYEHYPVKKQNHFLCGRCMENYENWYNEQPIPIFPFNHLNVVELHDIKTPVKINPYVEFFKKWKE